MLRLGDLSIKRKLMGIIMLASTTALLMACISFTVFDWISTKRAMVRNLETVAGVIANNSYAALEFDDSLAAQHSLAALEAEENMVAAVIYRADGTVLAQYGRDGRTFAAPPAGEEHSSFEENHLSLYHNVTFDEDVIGTVYVQSDLAELQSRLSRYVQILSIFIATSLLVGFLVAGILQPVISRPILALVEAANDITTNRDYSVRVDETGRDEVGTLISGFNEMLGVIEERELALQHARDELENRAGELQVELSERQRAEAARSKAESELEAQQTLSMRSDRLRSLGEMAAGIAHELNQPLVGVRGLAEHMLIGMQRGWELDANTMAERLERIVDQADRMTHIIEHVRMFARESGKPEVSPVDINDVVTSGLELLSEQFRSHGLTIDDHLGENLPTVRVNPFSLEEVLLNLLNNARDAVEEASSGELSEAGWVRVRTALRNRSSGRAEVLMQVEDNGPGIPDDLVAKVFDPFFTTKDPDKGTGLGLAISKAIVEEFDGSLSIEPKNGNGTLVTVALPAHE